MCIDKHNKHTTPTTHTTTHENTHETTTDKYITQQDFITFIESDIITSEAGAGIDNKEPLIPEYKTNESSKIQGKYTDETKSKEYDDDRVSTSSLSKLKSNPPMSLTDILIEQFHRISKPDGGIDGLLAYLDQDGDGVVSLNQVIRLCARESVFDLIDRYEAVNILKQHASYSTRHNSNPAESKQQTTEESKHTDTNGTDPTDSLSVVKLLKFLKRLPTTTSDTPELTSLVYMCIHLYHIHY